MVAFECLNDLQIFRESLLENLKRKLADSRKNVQCLDGWPTQTPDLFVPRQEGERERCRDNIR